MIAWQVKIDVILLFTCSIVIEQKFAAGQLQLCPPLNQNTYSPYPYKVILV